MRADDHAVVVGDGVFETMKIVDGAAFALSRHLRRLDRSASGLGLEDPDKDLIRTAIHEVLAADPSAGLLRITWSSTYSGYSQDVSPDVCSRGTLGKESESCT